MQQGLMSNRQQEGKRATVAQHRHLLLWEGGEGMRSNGPRAATSRAQNINVPNTGRSSSRLRLARLWRIERSAG